MKTIAIVATGGTIAGTGQAGKTVAYHAGEMNVNEIIKSIPMLKDVADLREYQFMNIDSNEMNPSRWIELANKMNVKNLLLYHTEDKTLNTRKACYTEEAAQGFSGVVHVPDDLEIIDIIVN